MSFADNVEYVSGGDHHRSFSNLGAVALGVFTAKVPIQVSECEIRLLTGSLSFVAIVHQIIN